MMRAKILLERAPLARAARQPAISYSRPFTSSSFASAEEHPKSTKGLKPKILDSRIPSESEQSEDVKKHNREMDQRADKAISSIENKDTYKDNQPPSQKKEQDGASDYDRQ